MSFREVRRWKVGDAITAGRLNESVDALNDLRGVPPPKEQDTNSAADVDEDTTNEAPVNEIWTFVSAQLSTVRLEDASDPSIFIDVQKTTSVTVRRPDGTTVRIELE